MLICIEWFTVEIPKHSFLFFFLSVFSPINPPSLCCYITMLGHLKDPRGKRSIVPSLISLVIPVLVPRPTFLTFLFLLLKLWLQSLQQVSLYAEPVQSLSDVSDQLSHAALLIQRLHDRVQLLEELYRTVSEKHSYWGLHYLRNMNRVWLFFSDGAVGIERQSQSFIQTPGFTTLCTYYCMPAFCWSTFPTT